MGIYQKIVCVVLFVSLSFPVAGTAELPDPLDKVLENPQSAASGSCDVNIKYADSQQTITDQDCVTSGASQAKATTFLTKLFPYGYYAVEKMVPGAKITEPIGQVIISQVIRALLLTAQDQAGNSVADPIRYAFVLAAQSLGIIDKNNNDLLNGVLGGGIAYPYTEGSKELTQFICTLAAAMIGTFSPNTLPAGAVLSDYIKWVKDHKNQDLGPYKELVVNITTRIYDICDGTISGYSYPNWVKEVVC